MGEFLSGDRLNEVVREVLRSRSVRCAVAFWGRGAVDLLNTEVEEAQIICNLESGATNPNEIEKLINTGWFEVRQCDTVQAKVYIGDRKAVITSANASANGLGLEAVEQGSWIEAGILVDDITATRGWFDTLWADKHRVREITDEDLRQARDAWRLRRTGRPSVGSFATFDPKQERAPLIIWYDNTPWEYDEKNIHDNLHYPKIDDT